MLGAGSRLFLVTANSRTVALVQDLQVAALRLVGVLHRAGGQPVVTPALWLHGRRPTLRPGRRRRVRWASRCSSARRVAHWCHCRHVRIRARLGGCFRRDGTKLCLPGSGVVWQPRRQPSAGPRGTGTAPARRTSSPARTAGELGPPSCVHGQSTAATSLPWAHCPFPGKGTALARS